MFAIEDEQDQDSDLRIAELESRVSQLEQTLARLLGAQALAPSTTHFAKTQKMATLEAESCLDDGAAPAAPDGLGITAAFALLDTRVAEAAEAEHAHRRKPDLEPILTIDPGLIEDRFEPRAPPAAPKAPTRALVRSALETAHPKILSRLQMTWRSRECLDYLNRLIVSDRSDRAGFEPAVMSELLLLSEILEAADSGDTWAANARAV